MVGESDEYGDRFTVDFELELLSVVALLEDSKDHKLLRGQVPGLGARTAGLMVRFRVPVPKAVGSWTAVVRGVPK